MEINIILYTEITDWLINRLKMYNCSVYKNPPLSEFIGKKYILFDNSCELSVNSLDDIPHSMVAVKVSNGFFMSVVSKYFDKVSYKSLKFEFIYTPLNEDLLFTLDDCFPELLQLQKYDNIALDNVYVVFDIPTLQLTIRRSTCIDDRIMAELDNEEFLDTVKYTLQV